jgi:hypothetical protein
MRLVWGLMTLVLGAFVVMMAPLLGFAHNVSASVSGVVAGFLLVAFGFAILALGRWASWPVVGLGVWLVISSFVLGFNDYGNALWATVTFGAVAIVLGLVDFLTGELELHGIGTIGEPRIQRPSHQQVP